mmetsp:Transcript_12214/g.18472  ORF Transcript_12214/g.18472 Transcript_12214/m.18472 type:complete len:714 (+) Transcript_12214:205-2346(+)
MSVFPSLFVLKSISSRAQILVKEGTSQSLRDAIELLLKNDTSVDMDISKRPDAIDCGALLHNSLIKLASSPYGALGVSVSANSDEIRRAYKKMALKYHPDKNPSTTPLFQVIQCAYEKLTVGGSTYAPHTSTSTPSSPPPSPAKPRKQQTRNEKSPLHGSRKQPSCSNKSPPKSGKGSAEYARYADTGRRDGEGSQKFKANGWTGGSGKQKETGGGGRAAAAGDNTPHASWTDHMPSSARGYAQGGVPNASNSQKGSTSFMRSQMEAREREARRRKEVEAAAARTAQRRYHKASPRPRPKENPPPKDYSTDDNSTPRFTSSKVKKSCPRDAWEEESTTTGIAAGLIPTPQGVVVSAVDFYTVEVSWNSLKSASSSMLRSHISALKVELSWGLADVTMSWESSSKLIAGEKVRKKNLISGATYHFRARYVIPPSSSSSVSVEGQWCTPVTVTLPLLEQPANEPAFESEDQCTDNPSAAAWSEEVPSHDDQTASYTDSTAVPVNADTSGTPQEGSMVWCLLEAPLTGSDDQGYILEVHKEKSMTSAIVGYISSAKQVLALEGKGKWLRVKCHWLASVGHKNKNRKASAWASGEEWGWAKREEWRSDIGETHVFLRPITAPTPGSEAADTAASSSSNSGSDVPVWYEHYDESGYPYYYNESTGESQWEPPEWVEEVDQDSGARYYVQLNQEDGSVFNSTWTKPQMFSRVVRHTTWS